MQSCWTANPKERPSFKIILADLETHCEAIIQQSDEKEKAKEKKKKEKWESDSDSSSGGEDTRKDPSKTGEYFLSPREIHYEATS